MAPKKKKYADTNCDSVDLEYTLGVDGVMDSDSDSDSDTSASDSDDAKMPKSKRKRRTRMKILTDRRASGEKTKIEFDANLEAIGDNANLWRSYLGLLGRSKVDICLNDWRNVNKKLKDKIWDDVSTVFDFQSTKALRKLWIQYVGRRWKDFKSKLTNRYIFGEKKGENPRERYSFITKSTWIEFVKSRMTPKFQEERKAAQANQAKNTYKHRLSRGGYRVCKQKMKEKKFNKRKQEAIDSGMTEEEAIATISPPSSPERHEMWVEARMKPDGEYTTEEALKMAKKIDSVVQEVARGEFVPSGRNDIFRRAFEKDESRGRIRGVGSRIGIKKFFGGCCKHASTSHNPCQCAEFMSQLQATQTVLLNLCEKVGIDPPDLPFAMVPANKNSLLTPASSPSVETPVVARKRPINNPDDHYIASKPNDDVMEQTSHKAKKRKDNAEGIGSTKTKESNSASKLMMEGMRDNNLNSAKSVKSTHTLSEPEQESFIKFDNGAICRLFVEDPNRHLVAIGKVYNMKTHHGKEISPDALKVTVDNALHGESKVPYEEDDIKTVAQGKGHLLLWPKKLIKLGMDDDETFVKGMQKKKKENAEEIRSTKTKESKISVPSPSQCNELFVDSKTLPQNCRLLYGAIKLMSPRTELGVQMDTRVMGSRYDFSIRKEDIVRLLAMEELSISCIQVYMMYLHQMCLLKGLCDIFGFMCPLESVNGKEDMRFSHIVDVLKVGKKTYYLAPIYESHDWMLCVINPDMNIAYWFDPDWKAPREDLKNVIQMAVTTYRMLEGKRSHQQKPLTWISLKHRQQKCKSESGFYVMRYMNEVIAMKQPSIPFDQYFREPGPFTQEQVDECRNDWAFYFMNKVLLE